MAKMVEATYEDGVFKPKTPVELENKASVRLIIEEVPETGTDDDPTGWKSAKRLIDLIQDEPEGLPVAREHDKYLVEE